jgi:hypothetical protein
VRFWIFAGAILIAITSSGWSRTKLPRLDQSDPKKMLHQIYGCAPNGCGYQFEDLPLSKELRDTNNQANAWLQRKSEPCIDHEPIWNGQESDDLIANYKAIEVVHPDQAANRTRIAVTMYPKDGFELGGKVFKHGDAPPPDRTVVYAFKKENGAWVVDDILSTVTGVAPQPVADSLRLDLLQCVSQP